MKITTPKICVIFILLFAGQISFAQTSNDSISVIKVANGVTKYFYNQDMASFENLWDENAIFITVEGLMAKGKDNIVDMHKMGKYIIDSSTITKLEPPVINFVSKDYAVVYSVWGGLVFKFGDKKGPVQSGYLTIVMRRKKNVWKILSATNAYNFSQQTNYNLKLYSHDLWKQWGIVEEK